MALETVATTLVKFKADTSDLEAGLKKLQGEEKKQQQALLDMEKARNESYDKWLGRLANVNQAIELGSKAVSVLSNAWKSYSEQLRLTAAAGSISIERLRMASLGLRTEHELLTFAAQTQNAAIKLTEDQMVTAQRAMVALTRAGFEQEEVVNKVTEALVKANGGGLDDFGILLKSNGSDLENFNELMDALAKKAAGVNESQGTVAESVQRTGVSMQDSIGKMNAALGQLVVAMAPLLDALARAVSLVADIAVAATKDVNWIDAGNKMLGVEAIKRDADINVAKLLGQTQAATPVQTDQFAAGQGAGTFDPATYATLMRKMGWAPDQQKSKSPSKPRQSLWGDDAVLAGMDFAGPQIGFGSTIYGNPGDWSRAGTGADDFDLMGPLLEKQKALTADWQTRLAAQQGKKTSFLESTFGKVEEFNAYGKAFDMLTGSVSAGLTAWIDGSMSAGQAMKKFLADALKGLASQMLVESLKHGAYAIGSLAFGDARGAGQHAAAAAAFGAGALAAGVAAKQLGGGGATTAASSGASAGSGAGGDSRDHRGSGGFGGLASQRESIVVVYTDPFATGSGRTKRHEASKVIGRALGRGESWREG